MLKCFFTLVFTDIVTLIDNRAIAEEPQAAPLLLAGKLKYSKDEPVRINCTSYSAFPATNLTWFINDKKVSLIANFTHYFVWSV